MTNIVARLLLAAGLVLAAPFFFFVLFMIFDELLRGSVRYPERFLFGYLISFPPTAIGFVIIWFLIWKQQLRGDGFFPKTAISFVGALAPTALVVIPVVLIDQSGGPEIAMVLGGFTWIIGFMAATALLWRESPKSRLTQMVGSTSALRLCHQCGFNLSGVTIATCPRCNAPTRMAQNLNHQAKSADENHGDAT